MWQKVKLACLVILSPPLLFIYAGAAIIARSMLDPNDDNFGAPRWVAALGGVSFLTAGLALLAQLLMQWADKRLPVGSLQRCVAFALPGAIAVVCFYAMIITALGVLIPEILAPSGSGVITVMGIPVMLPDWLQRSIDRLVLSVIALLLLGLGLAPPLYWAWKRLRRSTA